MADNYDRDSHEQDMTYENEQSTVTIPLKEYDKLSGDPVLLNTSFNDNGKPIIETPEDALEGLINMNIDYLVIGNTIVKKT